MNIAAALGICYNANRQKTTMSNTTKGMNPRKYSLYFRGFSFFCGEVNRLG